MESAPRRDAMNNIIRVIADYQASCNMAEKLGSVQPHIQAYLASFRFVACCRFQKYSRLSRYRKPSKVATSIASRRNDFLFNSLFRPFTVQLTPTLVSHFPTVSGISKSCRSLSKTITSAFLSVWSLLPPPLRRRRRRLRIRVALPPPRIFLRLNQKRVCSSIITNITSAKPSSPRRKPSKPNTPLRITGRRRA